MRRAQDRARSARFRRNGARSTTIKFINQLLKSWNPNSHLCTIYGCWNEVYGERVEKKISCLCYISSNIATNSYFALFGYGILNSLCVESKRIKDDWLRQRRTVTKLYQLLLYVYTAPDENAYAAFTKSPYQVYS